MTPKPHLSYSQIIIFERSPEAYARVYLLGEEKYTNAKMGFGKRFAEAFVENTEDRAIEVSKYHFIHYQKQEFEVTAIIPHKPTQITFKAVFDGYTRKTAHIGERKTGSIVWSQEKVDNNFQLSVYALVHWLKFKKLPKRITLEWLETTEEDGEIEIVNFKPLVFETSRTLAQCASAAQRIFKAYEGIEQLTKNYVGY